MIRAIVLAPPFPLSIDNNISNDFSVHVNTLSKESGRTMAMDAEEVRRRRAALGFSQEELARRLHVTRQSVYAWERGITQPPGMLDLALRWLEHELQPSPGSTAKCNQAP